MNAKLRTEGWHWLSQWHACVLAVLAGCTTLSTDPLSPPHVRRASTRVQETGQAAEEKMSPEYQEWLEECRHFWRDTKAEFAYQYAINEAWPSPYDELARESVFQPLAVQAENARLQMASLWDYHFDPATGELNPMGRNRLATIVDQADTLGRVVYVRRSPNRTETAARVASVRLALEQFRQGEANFEVVEASASPSLVSGDEAQKAMKLLTNPSKSESASSSGNSGSGYSGTGK